MHTRPTAVRFTSPADPPKRAPLRPANGRALTVGQAAARCPTCDMIVNVIQRNIPTRYNPNLPVTCAIFGKHTDEGTRVGRDDVPCAGTYQRARNLVTWQGTFDQWWSMTHSTVSDELIYEIARSAWDEARR